MGQDASTFVKNVDDAFLFVAGISLLVLIGIVVFMVYFVVRYSRKRNPVPTDIPGNTTLEVLWTAIPTVLFLGMFYFGWVGFEQMRNIPKNAIGLKVIARMWQWQFDYPNGVQTDTLYVPVNKPIKLEITSMDVNHSFFVPAFRIKRDAIPNMRNTMWFDATETGSFDVECAEYCG
jgi:cytochrome c oxidase subunit 2